MSNNKQMSVIDMLKQDLDIEIKAGVKVIVNWDGYKAIHEQEIIDAHTTGYIIGGGDGDYLYDCKDYYNKTFGGKDEQQ